MARTDSPMPTSIASRSSTTTPGSVAAADSALAPDIRELLQELAVAVHKRGVYPASHPMQAGAVDRVVTRLRAVLAVRHELAVGVAPESVVVDGHPTDPAHPLLRDLAVRLHEHHLAGLRILPGVTDAQVDACIAALAASPLREVEPLGVRGRDACTRWPQLVLIPAAFDHLSLLTEEEQDATAGVDGARNAALWGQLAHVAFAGGADSDADTISPRAMARMLESRAEEPEVLGAIHSMLDELDRQGPRRAEALAEPLSAVIEHLSEGALDRLLHMEGDRDRRAAFLARATRTLGRGAVIALVEGAARLDGRAISASVLRLLQKLARAGPGSRGGASGKSALHRVVRRLMRDWTLDDPNPDTYTFVLDDLAGEEAAPGTGARGDAVEPERMVELALDLGEISPSAEAALGRLVMRDGLGVTLQWLANLPAGPIRESLESRLVNVSMLREQLALPRPDAGVVAHGVARLRERAAEPLLTALERRPDSDAEWCVGLLLSVGESVVPPLAAAVPRLSPRTLRHVVTVFDRLDRWPDAVDRWALARHSDAGVRREVMRHLLRKDESRGPAALLGLRDEDLRTFSQALASVMRQCAPEAARLIMRRMDDPALSGELRARAVRALATAGTPEVRDWLCAQAITTRWLVGSVRLRKPSLEVSAAIGALARHFADDPAAGQVLRLAARSRDAAIREAVHRGARIRDEEEGE